MKNHQCQSFTYFSKAQEENNLPNFLYEARISLIPKQNQDSVRKEYSTPISLVNTDVVLHKVPNQIHSTVH